MNTEKHSSEHILFPEDEYQVMLSHCRRKLGGDFTDDEVPEPKAFGLIGGVRESGGIHIKVCLPLKKNVRQDEEQRDFMNEVMASYAIPSETPLENRGWIADPREMTHCMRELKKNSCTLIGTYHMHRVAWDHDLVRDTPTKLDTMLGKDSRLIMFIVSMVDPDKPILRAFSEGDIDKEIPVTITH